MSPRVIKKQPAPGACLRSRPGGPGHQRTGLASGRSVPAHCQEPTAHGDHPQGGLLGSGLPGHLGYLTRGALESAREVAAKVPVNREGHCLAHGKMRRWVASISCTAWGPSMR